MTKYRFLVIIFFAFLALTACIRRETYTIALVVSEDQTKASHGTPMKAAAEIVMREAQLDKPIDVKLFMNPNDPQESLALAKRIADDASILAVVGYGVPERLVEARAIYEEAELPVITPTINRNDATAEGSVVFRYNYPNRLEAASIAHAAESRFRAKRIVIINQIGRAYNQVATEIPDFIASKQTIALKLRFRAGEVDFRTVVTKTQTARPDLIVVIGNYRESAILITALRDGQLRAPIICNNGVVENDFLLITRAGVYQDNVYAFAPFVYERGASDEIDNLNDAYAKISGRGLTWIAFNAYEAFGVVTEAIRRGAGAREEILRELRTMTNEQEGYTDLSGAVYFSQKNDLVRFPVMLEIHNGAWVASTKRAPKFDFYSIYATNALTN